MRIIRVLACCDSNFLDSLWYFNIEKELGIVFEHFHNQFPEVGFKHTKTLKWDSPGTDELVLYPEKIVKILKGDVASFPDQLVFQLKSTGLSFSKKELKETRDYFDLLIKKCQSEEYSIDYLLGLFSGIFDSLIKKSLIEHLKICFPMNNEYDIVLAFTGKILRFGPIEISRSWLGFAGSNSLFTDNAYGLIGTWSYPEISPPYVILHEFGHIFGARHCKEKNSVMFESAEESIFIFDEENKKIIRKKIMGK